MNNNLEICLLGDVKIRWLGELLSPLPTRKGVLLLAYVLMHKRRPLERAHLAEVMWPEASTTRARRSLNTELWRLRQALGTACGLLQSDASTLSLEPSFDVWVDAWHIRGASLDGRLERLAAAAGVYGGDFLAGESDDWVISLREGLRNRYLEILVRLATFAQEQGDIERSIQFAQEILAQDPLRENVHQQLIRLYKSAGERVLAIRQYRKLTEILDRELGVSPLPETEALYGQLMGTLTGESMAVAASRPESTTFVGRREVMDLMSEVYEQVSSHGTTVLTIGGEPGIGKTRLVEQWIKTAAGEDQLNGALLFGRCRLGEQETPYYPLTQALRGALRGDPAANILNLGDVWLSELARLLPSIHHRRPHLPENPPLPPAQAAERFQSALVEAFQALACGRGRLILFLDDLHWVDRSTLDLLSKILDRLDECPLLVVCTYRSNLVSLDASEELPSWLETLAEKELLVEIDLEPLSQQETGMLVWQMAGTASAPVELANLLYCETEGNPLFIAETIQSLFEAGDLLVGPTGAWGMPVDSTITAQGSLPLPGSVRAVIETRMARLKRDQRDFLALAAVIGRQFEYGLLLAACGQDEARLLDHLAELTHSGLLRRQEAGLVFDFSHDKIREVIYGSLPVGVRNHLHGRIAGLIEARIGAPEEMPFEHLAYHYALSNDPGKAISYLQRAGERAITFHAYSVALDHFRRAQSLLPPNEVRREQRFEILMRCFDCLFYMGEIESAREILESILDLAPQIDEQAGLARAMLAMGTNMMSRTEFAKAQDMLNGARQAALEAGSPGMGATVLMQLAALHIHYQQIGDAKIELAEARNLARSSGDANLVRLADFEYNTLATPMEERARVYLSTLAEITASGTLAPAVTIASEIVSGLALAGRPGQALRAGEALLIMAQRQGHTSLESVLLRTLGRLRIEMGEPQAGRLLVLEALRGDRRIGYRFGEMRAYFCLALAAIGIGDFEEADHYIKRGSEICRRMASWRDLAMFESLVGGALVWSGQPKGESWGADLLQDAFEAASRTGFMRVEIIASAHLAEISLRKDDINEALKRSGRACEILERHGHAAGHEPLVLFVRYCALRAAGADTGSMFLRKARALLAQRVCDLGERSLRRAYLRDVPLHKAIRGNRYDKS